MTGRILIAGIGNIFHRDDAFGVEVVSQLRSVPENVRVVDFGIRGFDLMLALLEGYDLVVFVDTVQRGGLPGTLYKIEPDVNAIPEATEIGGFSNAHSLDPLSVLSMAKSLGAVAKRILVIGCEPEILEDDTGAIGLSVAVQASVAPAIDMIRAVIDEFCRLGAGSLRPERVIQ
ncbi:MAG TPA: hydrogenase maturation protease [Bryobacteraceae bacterium]|nr:hydrogenase maturation protease [Bryobacteraceae bacterium]